MTKVCVGDRRWRNISRSGPAQGRRQAGRTAARRVCQAILMMAVVGGSTAAYAQSNWTAPKTASARKSPLKDRASAAKAGRALFAANCVACHGNGGRGDGPASVALNPKPANLTSGKLWKETDGAIFWKISNGHTPMPAFGSSLSEQQRWQLVEFIRTLSPRPKKAAKKKHAAAAPKKKKTEVAQTTQPTSRPAQDEPPAAPADDSTNSAAADAAPTTGDTTTTTPDSTTDQGTSTAATAATTDTSKTTSDTTKSADATTDTTPPAADTTPAEDTTPPPATMQPPPERKGDTHFLFAGYGTAELVYPTDGDPAFGAAFNPIFLVKPTKNVMFEGEMEMEFEDGELSFALESAQIHLLATNFLTLTFGKFLNPMNYFVERQHPNWINKLPDKPLTVYDGLLAESLLGADAHGGVPLGNARLTYAIFASNAPTLVTDAADQADAGTLDFENWGNEGGHIATGGYVGILAIPQLQFGYGVRVAEVSPDSSQSVLAQAHSVNANFVVNSKSIAGDLAIRAQWVFSMTGDYTYDADGMLGYGPIKGSNNRNGGYAQISYRPSMISNAFFRNLEYVGRFSMLNQTNSPSANKAVNGAFGLDYWFAPAGVFKLAYEGTSEDGGSLANTIMAQAALGF